MISSVHLTTTFLTTTKHISNISEQHLYLTWPKIGVPFSAFLNEETDGFICISAVRCFQYSLLLIIKSRSANFVTVLGVSCTTVSDDRSRRFPIFGSNSAVKAEGPMTFVNLNAWTQQLILRWTFSHGIPESS